MPSGSAVLKQCLSMLIVDLAVRKFDMRMTSISTIRKRGSCIHYAKDESANTSRTGLPVPTTAEQPVTALKHSKHMHVA